MCAFLMAVALLLFPMVTSSQALTEVPQDLPREGFRAEYLADLAGLEKKVISLAEAIPQEKYEWRPTEGVRNFSEIFLHLANTNYTFPRMVGIAPPEGIDLGGMQASTTDRARIVKTLKASFAHARQGVTRLTDAEVEGAMGSGPTWTRRRTLVFQLRHASEHLGQLVAYARFNGITPPWTEDAQRRNAPRPSAGMDPVMPARLSEERLQRIAAESQAKFTIRH